MRYIEQFIKKNYPSVSIKESKTTETKYYHLDDNITIRLSCHVGMCRKKHLSIVKSFGNDMFVVFVEDSPHPLIKNRKEVKTFIKSFYEMLSTRKMAKTYNEAKKAESFEKISQWDVYWNTIVTRYPKVTLLKKEQKNLFREFFEKGLRGKKLYDIIKKTQPDTEITHIQTKLESILKTK